MRLKGTAVSPGIAIGSAQLVRVEERPVVRLSIPQAQVEPEVDRLKSAIEAAVRDTEAQKEVARSKLSEDFLAIFDAHIVILKDPMLVNGAVQCIRRDRVNAEFALHSSVQCTVRALLQTEDPYFQERAMDLEDLYRRVMDHLAGPLPQRATWTGDNLVVLAESLTPSEASTLHDVNVTGFATEKGARTSHTAIIARSLEIPAVVGVKGMLQTAEPRRTVIVDGLDGVVVLDPSQEEIDEYTRRAAAYRRHRESIAAHAREEARTVDGHRIVISANVDLPEEIDSAIKAGATGCGLYRSEFLFLKHAPDIPAEHQHAALYEQISAAFYPHRAVIRTFDLGGEKYFHSVMDKRESNPVLGVRAIRFCLRHPEIFTAQLRGILRASVRKNLAVLFPLITTVSELLEARRFLAEAMDALRAEGVPFDEKIPVGAMVEVPACALTAHAFAPHVDFFSIGTNDLIQYLLAIDRNNESVASLYDPLHPAVLQCIQAVCDAASAAGKHVAVCGEAASDPSLIPLFIGMGVEEFSMSPSSILDAKECVRGLSFRQCHKLARRVGKASTGPEAAAILDAQGVKAGR